MNMMDLSTGLKQLWNDGIRELNIYWLESNEEGDGCWWCDVINDNLCDLCKTSWAWTVMSRAERENEERHDLTMEEEEDWFIIVDEEKFSDDLVGDQIKGWLRDRGFKFEVEVIDSAGTKGEKQMLDAIEGYEVNNDDEKQIYINELQNRASLIGVAIALSKGYTEEDLMNAGYELEHQEMNIFLRENGLIPDIKEGEHHNCI